MNRTALTRTLAIVGVSLIWTSPLVAIEPLVANFGLGTMLHPVQEPASFDIPTWCLSAPCHKERVYIFGVDGVNPLCVGNFNGLLGYLRRQGFRNTHFGQLHTSYTFAGKIRDIRGCDPDARIALIGFSAGANYAKRLANALEKDCIKIDLLVYLAGDLITNTPSSHPSNVDRVVNVRAQGLVLTGGNLFFNGEDMPGARNVRLECRHILVPSRSETLQLMMQELIPLACMPIGGFAGSPNR
jgi:hypothetical protein